MDYEYIYNKFKEREKSKSDQKKLKYTELLQFTTLSSTGLMLVKRSVTKNDDYVFNQCDTIKYNDVYFFEICPTAGLMTSALRNESDEIRLEAIRLSRKAGIFSSQKIADITGLDKSTIWSLTNPPKPIVAVPKTHPITCANKA